MNRTSKSLLLNIFDSGIFILILWIIFGMISSIINWEQLELSGFSFAAVDYNRDLIIFHPLIMLIFLIVGAYIIHSASIGLLYIKKLDMPKRKLFLLFLAMGLILILVSLLIKSIYLQLLNGFYFSSISSIILMIYIFFQYWFHYHHSLKKVLRGRKSLTRS
ncbi:hypothetical protein [Alkalihalobacillus trypoxylicola]|uniref:Uncharacterized protein n=1 Tax=Alkalihalobacillus trypoxylicola TaxID=519424 RepID=A0A162EDB0_9BACI|nr:hypothetical protein [Alkalihalobacillus trypoxylicola]KYG32321.1 hypothetical protein AZF04_06035 [Alkalihalobacillus trypoxylicola]